MPINMEEERVVAMIGSQPVCQKEKFFKPELDATAQGRGKTFEPATAAIAEVATFFYSKIGNI